jgi:hypothetical protein
MRWLASTLVAVAAFAAPAAASAAIGYDISYPQCGRGFPPQLAFSVLGVNGGKPYRANPCLGAGSAPSELLWGGQTSQFYANTGDPGPKRSSHWPSGQASPKPCNTAANPGSGTAECHYDYGWNAAADSYRNAVDAFVSLGLAPPGATRTPAATVWWLDVESANTWTGNGTLNAQALRGGADYLAAVGAARVGFYSSPLQWRSITGGATRLYGYESWVAGFGTLAGAQAKCAGSGFTGGGVRLTQYADAGFDADYDCVAAVAAQHGR